MKYLKTFEAMSSGQIQDILNLASDIDLDEFNYSFFPKIATDIFKGDFNYKGDLTLKINLDNDNKEEDLLQLVTDIWERLQVSGIKVSIWCEYSSWNGLRESKQRCATVLELRSLLLGKGYDILNVEICMKID